MTTFGFIRHLLIKAYLVSDTSAHFFYVQVVSDNKVLGKFCGQNSTDRFHPGDKPILAPHNRLQLVFLTDVSNHELHIGFTAFYQAVGE